MNRSRVAVQGFTLVEAMVALALVGLVAVAVLAQTAGSTRAAADSAETLTATALAEHRLETLRLLDTRELTPLADSLRRGRFAAPMEGYAWLASVERVRDEPELVDVSVLVEWTGGSFPLRTRWYRP